LSLKNASSLALGTFAWDYNGGVYGADGSAADVEMYLVQWVAGGYQEVDLSLQANIAVGSSFGASYSLIVEIPTTTTANGSVFDPVGVAVVGEGSL
jgi:hypothetical protein